MTFGATVTHAQVVAPATTIRRCRPASSPAAPHLRSPAGQAGSPPSVHRDGLGDDAVDGPGVQQDFDLNAVAPVRASPAAIAACTGAARAQRGSSEKCRLIRQYSAPQAGRRGATPVCHDRVHASGHQFRQLSRIRRSWAVPDAAPQCRARAPAARPAMARRPGRVGAGEHREAILVARSRRSDGRAGSEYRRRRFACLPRRLVVLALGHTAQRRNEHPRHRRRRFRVATASL